MGALLVELDTMNRLREQTTLRESENKPALIYLRSEKAARLLIAAGKSPTIENICDYTFYTPQQVNDSLKWMVKKKKALPFELNAPAIAPQSVLDQILCALMWLNSRQLSRATRPVPAEDKNPIGVQRIMLLTGLERMEILQTIEDNMDVVVDHFPDFKPSWVSDTKEIQQKNAKNQHQDSKIKWIRAAVMDIAKGRARSVTAAQLEKWNNGKIGYSQRQIDNLLSNHEDLRDLDIYRANGRTSMRPTDKDRAIAYDRDRNN